LCEEVVDCVSAKMTWEGSEESTLVYTTRLIVIRRSMCEAACSVIKLCCSIYF